MATPVIMRDGMELDGGGAEAQRVAAGLPTASEPTAAGAANDTLGTRVQVTYDRAAVAYLQRGLFPVPAKGVRGKQPKFCHKYDPKKTDLWTRQRAKAYGRWHECDALGLLLDARRDDQAPGDLRGLLVLDFDTKGLFATYLQKFAEFTTCPLAKTRHGFHAYFMRSKLCDAMALTDGARQFEDADGKKLELDVKSYTKSGVDGHSTAGFISVPPSDGKEWIRNLCTTAVTEISDELVGHLCERKVSAKKRKPAGSTLERAMSSAYAASGLTFGAGGLALSDGGGLAKCARSASPSCAMGGVVTDDELSRAQTHASTPAAAPAPLWWHLDPERAWRMSLPCLRAMGFKTPENMAPITKPNERSRNFGYVNGFQFFDPAGQTSGPCVVCGKLDNHTNNSFRVMFWKMPNGAFGRVIKNYSENCLQIGARTKLVPFSPEGARAYAEAYLPACDALPEGTLRAAVGALQFTTGGGWAPRAAWVRDGRLVFLPTERALPARVVDLRLSAGRLCVFETHTPWEFSIHAAPLFRVLQSTALLRVLSAEPRLLRSAPTCETFRLSATR
jgi:hypothetical protein